MFSNFGKKKLFFLGFAALLLVGIPVTIYFLQQQQNISSHAQASTDLSFTPTSSATSPLNHNIGDKIPLAVMVDPGTNLVSFIKLDIQYDPTVLATPSGQPAFVPNTSAFPSVLEGPVYSSGQIQITLSVGPDPTKAIQALTQAGTLTLQAIANTNAGTPTLVTFASDTQVLSIGPNDQASENVLSTSTPATIVIGGQASTSPTTGPGIPTATPSPTPVLSPTTVISPGATATPTPTPVPGATETPTPSPTGAPGTATTDVAPTCSSLATDRSPTGTEPFSLTFTTNGNSTTSTISQVTFNFGDGAVSNVTTGGGIGTASVNVQIAHTYNNAGTYQATATLTDASNMTSSSSASCTQTVTVNSSTGGGGSTLIAQSTPGVATPTMRATGSTSITVGVGAIALTFILGGAFLFFAL